MLVRSFKTGIASVLVCYACGAPAEWLLDTALAMQYNDNLSNASLDRDIKKDTALDLTMAPAYHLQVDGFTGLTAGVGFEAVKQLDYIGLDRVSAEVRGAVRRKFGLGLYAPWSRISGTVRYSGFNDDQRDGWSYTLSVAAGRYFTERLSVQVSYRFESHHSNRTKDIPALVQNFGIHGDAFDTDAHNFGITGLYQLNERLSLVLGYTFRTGAITASTLRNSEIFEASDAIAADPVFGPERFAYRIDADTSIFSAGVSFALNYRMSFNVNYAYQDSDAYEDLAYSNNLVRVELLYSF